MPKLFFGIVLAALIIYTLLLFVSFVWGFFASIKSYEAFRKSVWGLPDWAFSNYPFVYNKLSIPVRLPDNRVVNYNLASLLPNTLMYVLGGALLATLAPCLMAYLNVKFKYRFNKIVYGIVLVTMMLPIVGSLPSEIKVLKAFGLYDTMFGMWIMKAHFLGLYFLVFHASFRAMPKDFAEAAYIDGCSEWALMTKIAFPLVRNTFFIVMLINGIGLWNDYQIPMLYIPSWPTFSTAIFWVAQTNENELSSIPLKLTGSFILMAPVLILFIVFHNKLIGNISMGGIKE